MYKRKEFRIKSEDFQALLNNFTLGERDWTAYSSGVIDLIMRYQMRNRLGSKIEVDEFMYAKFDGGTNELVFVGPAEWDNGQDEIKITVKEIDRSQETFKQLPPNTSDK